MVNKNLISYQKVLKNFKKLLKSNGLKYTNQRELILKIIYNNEGHFTPEDIYYLIRKNYPKIRLGMATVYRTLTLLENGNIVTSISFGTKGKRYEFGLKEHHDHLVCLECGAIEEFVDEIIEDRQQEIAKRFDFEMSNHIMKIIGKCSRCRTRDEMVSPFRDFGVEDIEGFPKKLEKLLQISMNRIDILAKNDSTDYRSVLKPLQDIENELEFFFTPLSHLNSVKNSEKTKEAYQKSLPQLSKFSSELIQKTELFNKLKRMNSTDKEANKVIDNWVKRFILTGAELGIDKKKELEEINIKLSELSNDFAQNILDSIKNYELIMDREADVEGIPKEDLSLAETKRDGKKVYKFTLQMPSYISYMTYGKNRKYREELYRAYTTKAPKNGEIIDKILFLRDKKAKILGFDSYASYSLADKDAQSVEDVSEFLEKLLKKSRPHAVKEFEELKGFAKKLDGIDTLEPFDIGYYSEKLKKDKFDFDDNMTKPYFEQGRVLKGLLDIISELFSVEFREIETVVWHEKVRVFDLYEFDKLSGRVYFDLEAREEKRGGAWAHDWESHFIDAEGKKHLPSVFINCNFSSSTKNRPSLLRHGEVVTLFHEMGHGIHHLFSKCTERSVSGFNGVAWDVIEFPSQFLEHFAYEKEILKRFAVHYKTGEPIEENLLDKIKKVKNYQVGMGTVRQMEFSIFDFELHKKLYQKDEVQNLLDGIRKRTSLMKVPSYNRFQNSFSHIFSGGYSAGYYSYKWAEVLSADAFLACLDKEGKFDLKRAEGYKKHILERGGSENMSILYKQWLGRVAKVESLVETFEF